MFFSDIKRFYIAFRATRLGNGYSHLWRRTAIPVLGTVLACTAPGASAQTTPADSSAAIAALWSRTLPDAGGAPQALARYRGKPVVINFWASWCGPCVQEMPELSALSQQYSAKGIQFIGIGIDSPANISNFLAKVSVKYPIYVAGFGGADISRSLGDGAGALPFTVVVDRSGAVRYTKLGKVDATELAQIVGRL